jgi:type I restriction enzyme S subunit
MVSALSRKSSANSSLVQTELGLLPADWLIRQIGEIAYVGRGRVISHREINKAKEPKYPVYSSQTKNDGVMGYLDSYDFEGDYITWTTDGANAGTVFRRSGRFNCTNVCGTIKSIESNPSYIAYALGSLAKQHVSKHLGNPKLMNDVMKRVSIPLPPNPEEQQAIAAALSDADALIEALESLIAKKRAIKQGAMQELLSGRRRSPGFKTDWKPVRLSDIAQIRSGGTPSTVRTDFWDGDVLWCTPTDITALGERKYLRDTTRKITDSGLKNSSAEWIPAKSVIMTSRATIGECAINVAPVTTNQGFKNLVPHAEIDAEFLYYFMSTQKERLIALCGGSTFLEIGKTQLSSFEITIPTTKQEQVAISTILAEMDSELEALTSRLAKARQIKLGMMQELLTGRVRLV